MAKAYLLIKYRFAILMHESGLRNVMYSMSDSFIQTNRYYRWIFLHYEILQMTKSTEIWDKNCQKLNGIEFQKQLCSWEKLL